MTYNGKMMDMKEEGKVVASLIIDALKAESNILKIDIKLKNEFSFSQNNFMTLFYAIKTQFQDSHPRIRNNGVNLLQILHAQQDPQMKPELEELFGNMAEMTAKPPLGVGLKTDKAYVEYEDSILGAMKAMYDTGPWTTTIICSMRDAARNIMCQKDQQPETVRRAGQFIGLLYGDTFQ